MTSASLASSAPVLHGGTDVARDPLSPHDADPLFAALQRLQHAAGLAPENTVVVGDGAGPPPALGGYGVHTPRAMALPVAEGVKASRPELDVFVVTDAGAAGLWPALRRGADITVLLCDDSADALAPALASPHGGWVGQAADWLPDTLDVLLRSAHRHHGLALLRVLRRGPEPEPGRYDPSLHDPANLLLLTHEDGGLQPTESLVAACRNQEPHAAADLDAARAVALQTGPTALGLLYRGTQPDAAPDAAAEAPAQPCARRRAAFESLLDRHAVPDAAAAALR